MNRAIYGVELNKERIICFACVIGSDLKIMMVDMWVGGKEGIDVAGLGGRNCGLGNDKCNYAVA